jgi:hypothetical protein
VNRETWEQDREGRRQAKRRERATITWLEPPVRLVPGKGIMVVGVCSDASQETKAMYGVRV